jgi:predicted PurR-regulated permease PerM
MQVSLEPAPEPVSDIAAPEPVSLSTPINVRSVSLAVIAVLACIYVLHWASAVFIPLLLGLLSSYALSPVVSLLQRWRIPRVLGAAAVLIAVVGGLGSMFYSISDDAATLIESLPEAAQKVREAVRATPGEPDGAMEKMQQTAERLEQAARESGTGASAPARGVTRVQVEPPRFNIKDYLWSGTMGLAGLVGQATVVFFIAFFLLTSGDSFRRKMVRIAGPTLSRKKVTLQVLNEITDQIQHYLMLQVFAGVLVGMATWGALLWLGVEGAAVWGLVAAVLNLVPYLGSIMTAAGLALVVFLQFGTLGMSALVGGVSLLINTIEGNLLTPWLTGRASRMNPVVIFIGVLAWGWLWGLWGLLLGPPLMMVVKAVCDHIDDLKPIGELLGD